MKKITYLIVSALLAGSFAVSAPIFAQLGTGNAVIAKQITPEEAAKKYPLPAGKKEYPKGIRTEGSEKAGFCRSPFDSKVFDCRSLKPGMLVLDTYARPPQVFVVPGG